MTTLNIFTVAFLESVTTFFFKGHALPLDETKILFNICIFLSGKKLDVLNTKNNNSRAFEWYVNLNFYFAD